MLTQTKHFSVSNQVASNFESEELIVVTLDSDKMKALLICSIVLLLLGIMEWLVLEQLAQKWPVQI